jgi:hypothetical protein
MLQHLRSISWQQGLSIGVCGTAIVFFRERRILTVVSVVERRNVGAEHVAAMPIVGKLVVA